MPFTLSHAAAAIPFRRTRLIMSAMVMGCFVPDFPHFTPLSPRITLSHTVAGMFVLDLPLGFAALWLFHVILKEPMLLFLPGGMRRRLRTSVDSFAFWPWERLGLIVLSILAGTTTHLLWDAFTHRDSWIYEHWAFLRGWVHLPVTGAMQITTLLEYGSSVFGVLVVAFWIWHWYGTTRPLAAPAARPLAGGQRRAFVVLLPALALLGGAMRAYRVDGIEMQIRAVVHFTTDMLISAITIFLLELLVSGVILRRQRAVPVGV